MTVHEEHNQFCNSSSGGDIYGGGGGGGECGGVNDGVGGGNRSSKRVNEKKAARRGLGVAQLEMLRMQDLQKKNVEKDMLPVPSSIPDIENFPKFDVCWPSISFPSIGCLPKIRHPYQVNRERENPKLDQNGLMFNIPFEFDNVGPLTDLVPRMPYQYQHSSSSLADLSSMNTFHIEPPSIQSYYNNQGSSWREEEKIIGLKRPYPLPLESPTVPAFLGKYPAISYPIHRSDESTSSGDNINLDNAVSVSRDAPPCPRGAAEPKPKRPCRENAISGGDLLLTVGLPSIFSAHPSSRFMPFLAQSFSPSRDLINSGSLHCLGNAETRGLDSRSGGSSQRPFFKFLHEPKVPVAPTTRNFLKANGVIGESLDLNLKL